MNTPVCDPAAPPDIVRPVADYYAGRLREHGPTPRGVDWNSTAAQEIRFEQVLRICDLRSPFTLLDYGCGYAALHDYLAARRIACRYVGYDIADDMIAAARRRHPDLPPEALTTDAAALRPCDYVVCSGLFNVRLATDPARWEAYVLATIDRLAALAVRGFAFNALTRYSDPEKRRADLHYSDPAALFDYCKRRHARNVALLHDYDLYEFTILVRK